MKGMIDVKTIYVSEIIKNRLAPGKEARELLNYVTKKLKTVKEIELDFNGTEVSDNITIDDSFKKLVIDDKYAKVHLKFYNKPQIVKMCQLLLKVSGKDITRVENLEPVTTQVYQTADEVYQSTPKSERLTKKLLSCGTFVDDDAKVVIIYYNETPNKVNVLNAINNKDAIVALRDAVVTKLNETGYRKALVDFGNMELFTNRSVVIAAAMVNLFQSMITKHYVVEFKLQKEEDKRLLEMMHEIPSMSTDTDEILEKIDVNLEVGSVGLLSEYVQKETKVDNFGHYGNGKVATRQPAIYLGRDGMVLKFRVYDAHTFMRRVDWIARKQEENEKGIVTLMHNQEFELKYKDISINLEDIGICKFCNGARYYFSLAIQSKPEEFLETHYIKEDGTYGTVKVILPKFIEMVLNEQQQEYNLQMLLLCVEETENRLREARVEIEDLSRYNLNAVAV